VEDRLRHDRHLVIAVGAKSYLNWLLHGCFT
jgi:hypothetical protein